MHFSYDDAARLEYFNGCGYLPQIITTQIALKYDKGSGSELDSICGMINEVSPIVGIGKYGVFAVPKGRFFLGSNPEKGDDTIGIGDMTRLIGRSSGQAVYTEPHYMAIYGIVDSTPSLIEIQGIHKYLSLEITRRLRELNEEDVGEDERKRLDIIIASKTIALRHALGYEPMMISSMETGRFSAKRVLCPSIKELMNPFAEVFNPMCFDPQEITAEQSEKILAVCEEIMDEYLGETL